MEVLNLQEICYVKLSVMFSTGYGMKQHLKKQINGIVQADDGLRNLEYSIYVLPLPKVLRNRLFRVTEKLFHELSIFLTKSSLNYPEVQLNLAEDIHWHADGLINEKSTYVNYFEKNPNDLLYFECLCLISAEEELEKFWPKVQSEKNRLKMNNLLVSFWIHSFQGNLNDFINRYRSRIIGFESDKNVNFNMIRYCLNYNFKSALEYFFDRLSFSEKQLLIDEDESPVQVSIFKKMLVNPVCVFPNQENFKFICSFLEKPIGDNFFFELITGHMPVERLLEFLNYVLGQVNFFGKLHLVILKMLFSKLNDEAKCILQPKLDFYVLSLVGKGHLETFQFAFKNAKELLLEQIRNRLKNRRLSLFYSAFRNNRLNLLNTLLREISDNDEELLDYAKEILFGDMQVIS